MSSARLNVRNPNSSSFNLLHSGVRRTVDRSDYTKLFTKIKIAQPKRQSFLPSSGRDPGEEILSENTRLRQMIKELEVANSKLASALSKEEKLQSLLSKRIETENVTELSFDKAMEIKLMLEVDVLQQRLKQKEKALEMTVKQFREREETMKNFSDSAEVDLYAILCDGREVVAHTLQEKEKFLEQQQEQIVRTKERTQRARETRKVRAEELKEMEKMVEKAKESLPSINKITDENDSGIYGTQIRAKTTETFESEIERLRAERIAFEGKIQRLIEQKVREKIEVLKVINQLENSMICQRQRQ